MDLRSRIRISSSWELHGDITTVFYIVSSSDDSGIDEPLPTGQPATPIYLTAPTSAPNQSCTLTINLTNLRGYIPTQIELTTSSRTTELYRDEDDYIGTVRGSVVGNYNANEGGVCKLYRCNHILPFDGPCSNLCIKLLSLRGMAEVLIDRIQLQVTPDHSGSATTPPPHPTENSVSLGGKADMQQLLSSLPANSMPPFIQTLVSSLTNLTSQVSSEPDDENSRPHEISQLMDTLRLMRPTTPVQVVDGCDSNKENDEIDRNSETVSSAGKPVSASEEVAAVDIGEQHKLYLDEKFGHLQAQLEAHLKSLIDGKFKQLETHLDLCIDRLEQRLEKRLEQLLTTTSQLQNTEL